MTHYTVHLSARVSRDVDVEAESPEAAVAKVMETQPEAHIEGPRVRLAPDAVEEIDGDGAFSVFGCCESCATYILEGRDAGAGCDDDGVWVCRKCATVFEAGDHAAGGAQ